MYIFKPFLYKIISFSVDNRTKTQKLFKLLYFNVQNRNLRSLYRIVCHLIRFATLLSLKELVTTHIDEKLIAADAIIGERANPRGSYNAPAAIGIHIEL